MSVLKFSSEKIKTAAADHVELLVTSFVSRVKDCFESPIELMLFEALAAYQFCSYGRFPKVHTSAAPPAEDDVNLHITPQAQVGDYRLDFLIWDSQLGVRVAVECDGHDFHERTKTQARKDRSRDRELQAKGFLVLRYTGSEIWRDPWGCAEDIERKIFAFEHSSVDRGISE